MTVLERLRAILQILVGNWQWQPPAWIRWTAGRVRLGWRFSAADLRRLAVAALVLVSVAAGWIWYKNRPVPHCVTFTVTAPALTEYNENILESIDSGILVLDLGSAPGGGLGPVWPPKALPRGYTADPEFRVSPQLPEELRVGYLQPGATYRATVRLSNAAGVVQSDTSRDLRGAAVRVHVSQTEVHDLLMTNGPVSHARNAPQFIAFARAMAGSKLLLPFRLLFGIGPLETVRIFRTIGPAASRPVTSLATERFWSRAPATLFTTPPAAAAACWCIRQTSCAKAASTPRRPSISRRR